MMHSVLMIVSAFLAHSHKKLVSWSCCVVHPMWSVVVNEVVINVLHLLW